MKLRKFGSLGQADSSTPVSVSELQGRLLAMLFPVRPTGSVNDNTVSGLSSYMRQLGIADLNLAVGTDQRSVTLTPSSILSSIRQTSDLAMRLIPRLPAARSGTWGSVLVRYFQARNMIPQLNQSMGTAISGGSVTPEIRTRYERLHDDLDAVGTKIAAWIESKPALVTRLNELMGQVANSNAQFVLDDLRTPLPRVVTVEQERSLGALPVVALVVGVCVVAAAIAVPIAIHEWNKPAVLQAEAELLRAEAELEALRVVDRGLARGLTPDELNQALDGVTELRESRPQPSSGFPWGLTVGLLIAAGLGIWFWKRGGFSGPEGEMLTEGDEDEVIEPEIVENPKPLPPLPALLPENA